ncbi:MAG: MFS transporter [Magnetospiraceae bacterium]
MTPPHQGRGLISWCFYDWANSAYPTVIFTFVFATYFAKGVAPDEVTGQTMWGYMAGASAFAVALAGPLLGAIADRTGRRKPWIGLFTALCVFSTPFLWFAEPDGANGILWILVIVGLSNFAFETAIVFYNAMLPALAPPSHMGRWSGWAWGLGYFGGLNCLALCLFLFVQGDPPPFDLDKSAAEHVRIVAPIAALWTAAFSLPLFFWTPDSPSTGVPMGRAARDGLRTLVNTFRQARRYGRSLRFLIARMIYIDGINTLFAFGGIYAAGTFAMDFDEVIIFGIGINATAGLGALAFAWIDDWLGPRKTVLISLVCIIILGTLAVLVTEKLTFWIIGLGLGAFFGPVQAASRTFMGRLAPKEMRGEMFGLYALSGKATAFLGPLLLAIATQISGSQRIGMASILVFLVVGLILLWPISDRESPPAQ